MPESLGIFGGSFDPVHSAHLAVAQAARRERRLDRVLFIPAAIPPHKRERRLASDTHRLAMLRLALEGQAGLEVDDRELRRGGISYTIDTVEELRRERGGDAQLTLILGSDSLPLLPQWKDAARLLDLVEIAVYPRKGFSLDDLDSLAGKLSQSALSKLRRGFLSTPPVNLSATEIRERWARGESLAAAVPESVANYLRRHDVWK